MAGRKPSATGVAEEGSPRREPWGKMRDLPRPREGRQTCDQRESPFAASRLRLIIPEPTADAVGYHLPLLPQLFATVLKD